jgi:DNA-binding NarL/FixJ family response regulator
VAVRIAGFHRALRPTVLFVVGGVTGLLVAAAAALRSVEQARQSADTERQQLGEAMRSTLTEVLRSGGGATGADEAPVDVEALVSLATDPADGASRLRQSLAAHLAPAGGQEEAPSLAARLSAREVEVLGLVAAGMTDTEIARQLYVSRGTVRVHVSNAVRKLGAADRDDAVGRLLGPGTTGMGRNPRQPGRHPCSEDE